MVLNDHEEVSPLNHLVSANIIPILISNREGVVEGAATPKVG